MNPLHTPDQKSIPRPVRASIVEAAKKLGLLLLHSLALPLIFPISLRTSLPVLLSSAVAIALLWRYFKLHEQYRLGAKRYLASAISMLVIALLTGSLLPFVINPAPIYWYSHSADPTKSTIEIISVSDNDAFSLMALADPLRKQVALLFAKKMPDRVIALSEITISGKQSIVLPLKTAIHRSQMGATQISTIEKLIVPAFGVGVTVTHTTDGPIEYSFGPSFTCLVNTTEFLSVNVMRWRYVLRSGSQDDYLYSALLDRGIMNASTGEIPTAIAVLELAAVRAQSDLERSRTLALLAEISRIRVGGSLGGLQRWVYRQSAYNAFMRHLLLQHGTSDSRLMSPVESWIYGQLEMGFRDHPMLFQDQLREMENIKINKQEIVSFSTHVDNVEPTTNVRKFLADIKQDDTLLSPYISSVFESSIASLQIMIKNFAKDCDTTRLFHYALTFRAVVEFEYRQLSTASQMLDIADTVLAPCPARWRSELLSISVTIRKLISLRNTIESSSLTDNTKMAKLAQYFQSVGLTKTQSALSDIVAGHIPHAMPAPKKQWWDQEFLDWFLATMIATHGDAPPIYDHQYDPQQLSRDMSGAGLEFAPGMAVLGYAARGTALGSELDERFYHATGAHLIEAIEINAGNRDRSRSR